jgi:membrane-anchored glycerophosphoryl diester phosphodiesterase (GDPDase)
VAFVILFALLAGSGLAGLAENASLEQLFTTNPALAIGVSLLVVLLVLGLIAFLLWLGARLSVPELSLAVEREATASGAISRSWQLTKSNAWRVALVLFVTFLITLPLVILTQLVVNALQAAFMVTVSEETPGYAGLLLLVSYAFSFLSNVFMLPLWQAIKATIYYDLRSRREGIDLELRDRRL